MKKKKYIIIIIVVLILIILLISGYFIFNKNTSNKDNINNNIRVSEVIDIDDIDNNDIELKETNTSISSNYKVKEYKLMEIDKDIQLGSISDSIEFGKVIGRILYLRSEELNANIFQTSYEIDINSDMSPLIQVLVHLDIFKDKALEEIKLSSNAKPLKENVYGIDKWDKSIPIEEIIYNNKGLYVLTYEKESTTYEINFYMKDDNFICELVKIL